MFVPTVGVTYSFSFNPGYTDLDGIYCVTQILTLQEMLTDNNDFLKNFYIKAGKTIETYNEDLLKLKDYKVLKLLNPSTLNEDSALFVSMYYLAKQPDHNVKKYYKLALGLNLGVFDNAENMSYLTANISQMLSSALGITNAPELFVIDEVWLTTDSYKDIEDNRTATGDSVINYFSENVRLQNTITDLRSRLAAYEEIIKNIANTTTSTSGG